MSLLRADKIANRFNNTGPIIVGPSTVSGNFTVTGIATVLGLGVTNNVLVGNALTANYLTASNGANLFNSNLTGITTAGIVTGATYYGNGVNLTGVVTSVVAGAGVQISPVSGQGRVTISATGVAVAGYATNAGLATDIKGGTAGAVLYQSGVDNTAFSAVGSAGEILQSNGTAAPSWTSLAAINVAFADTAGVSTNIQGGSAGRIPVQSGVDQTTFMPVGVTGNIILAQGTSTPIYIDPKASLDVRRARFAGIATNLQSGYISSATSLEVTGVTTLGVTTAKTLDVTGITTTDLLNVGTAGTIPNLTLSNSGIAVTAILDEDDMVSNRADALATQQSIRAYVDATRTGIGLTFDADTGTGTIDLDEETFTIEGTANEIYTIGAGNTVTVGLDTNVTVPNNLVVSGFSSLSGLTTITGSLGVTGITTTQNLEVIGVSTIGTLGVTGVTTTQFLEVTGVTTTATLGVSGVTTSQFLEVTGVSTFGGNVNLGSVTVNDGNFNSSNLTGVTTAQTLGVSGVTTTQFLEVTGVSTLTGYVTAGTGLTVAGTGITATTLNVTGFSTQTGFATFGSSVNVANQFYAGGISSVGAGITMFPSSGIVSATAFYGDGSNLTGVVGLVSVTNIIFVTPDGNDDNDGYLVSTAKRTVGSALTIAEASTVIKVSAGNYSENNPLILPEQVSIQGDSLREVSLSPQNSDKDFIYVANGNYVDNVSFTGTLDEGKAIIAFNPDKPSFVTQGPYIRNCSNFISNSIGMKIDGDHVIGDTKAMNVDSYTQINQGGIGVSISNNGYAQLVSIFTIYNDQSIVCINGGQCDLTNSNSSFGRLGLVADGVGNQSFIGTVTTATTADATSFTINVGVDTLGVTTAVYTASTGIVTITTPSNHGFNAGQEVEIRDLEFTCPGQGSGIATFPSGNYGYIFTVDAVGAANSFSSYIGVSTLAHDYVRAGVVSSYVPRPYDGLVTYFDELYLSISDIEITSGGSGYTSPPTITIAEPSESWGIRATATGTITNGVLTSIDMISNGRGYTSAPAVTISGSATGTATTLPTYYVVNSATPIVNGITTVTVADAVPYAVGVATEVPFFKQSKILASSHAFEYIGSGNTATTALPQRGGVGIQANEIINQNGGLVVFTSTDQAGNFRIGNGVVINQQDGSISGEAYTRSLFANITPYILALGGGD